MAEKQKKCPECKGGAPEYMLTYGDMVTLLLTFFVLMFTVGEADPREMRLVLSAFTGSLGMFSGGKTLSKGELVEMGMKIESLPSRQKGTALARSIKEAQEILKPELRSKQVRVQKDERGVRISLGADTFFEPGSAKLRIDKAAPILRKVKQLIQNLKDTKNKVKIEGHTDNTPLEGGDTAKQYGNNWGLSTARALSVLNFLVKENVDQSRLEVSGYSQYQPLENNNTPEGRAYNRRVDIYIQAK